MTPQMQVVLGDLAHLPLHKTLELALSSPQPFGTVAGLDTAAVDELLRDAVYEGYVDGKRYPGDGSVANWSNLELTARALRELGEWPPEGGENLPGPWDQRLWGNVDRPLLVELDAAAPHAREYISGPLGDEDPRKWACWASLRRLHRGGLLAGFIRDGGLTDARVTNAGKRGLDADPVDPLDRARIELQRGAKVDALTAAVEQTLASVLRMAAQAHGISTENGELIKLATVNNQLKTAGVYDESVRAEIEWCLKVRNETNHGRGDAVSDTRIARVIDAVEELRDRL